MALAKGECKIILAYRHSMSLGITEKDCLLRMQRPGKVMRSKSELRLTLWDTGSGNCIASFSNEAVRSITVGRDQQNDLQLSAKGVSKTHCQIRLDDGKCDVQDLDSTNGVVIIRKKDCSPILIRSKVVELHSGDSIQLGEACIRIEIDQDQELHTEIVISPVLDATEMIDLRSRGNFSHSGAESQRQVELDNPMRANQTYQPNPLVNSSAHNERVQKSKDESLETRLVSEGPFSFSRYQVIKKIGEGGMGTVYSAIDEKRAVVAIKFLKSKYQSSQDLARFSREIEIAQQLKHAAIVDCLDCGQEDGIPYIVMPYCSGGNLAELLARAGSIQLRRALKLLDRLVAGLEYAHQLGIVHRDLKPCNILLGKDSKGKYRPMISDFGLAKFYQMAGDSGMTTNGTVGGSWPYMPREQLTNFRFVTPQSDVWSMGAILYECLTGQLPRGPSPKKDPFLAVLNAEVIPISNLLGQGISQRLSRFVMKCLAIDLDERFSDAAQMRVALQAVAKAEGIEL